MNKGILFSIVCLLTLQASAQWTLETTFTQYKQGKAVENKHRSLFDSQDHYDKKNRLIKKVYVGTAAMGAHAEFEYNNKDQKIKETHVDSTGKVRTTKNFTYNDQGKIHTVVFEWTEKNGDKRNGTEEYFYDDKNELIRKTYTSSKSGLESEWFFENKTENGHKIVTTRHISKGKEQKAVVVEYNEKDLVIKEGTLSYEYEYDKKGDWIVKRMFRNGELVGEYKRVKTKD